MTMDLGGDEGKAHSPRSTELAIQSDNQQKKEEFTMDKIKKPQEEVSAATAELTQTELDKVAGGGTVSAKPNVSEVNSGQCARSDGGGATVGRAN
jgi:hypothetical protein